MRWSGFLLLVGGLGTCVNVRGESSEEYFARLGGVAASVVGALLYLEGFKHDLVDCIKAPAGQDRPRAPNLPPEALPSPRRGSPSGQDRPRAPNLPPRSDER